MVLINHIWTPPRPDKYLRNDIRKWPNSGSHQWAAEGHAVGGSGCDPRPAVVCVVLCLLQREQRRACVLLVKNHFIRVGVPRQEGQAHSCKAQHQSVISAGRWWWCRAAVFLRLIGRWEHSGNTVNKVQADPSVQGCRGPVWPFPLLWAKSVV